MPWWEYLLLAVASIFWPLLFAFVVVALASAHPVRALVTFLVAGLLTTTAVGCAIVFGVQNVDALSRSSTTGRPAVYLAAGFLSLVAARIVARRPPQQQDQTRLTRYVSSVPVTFGAGIVLNVFPGVFPFVALMDIAQTSYEPRVKVLLVFVFYVIMFASVEAPILSYAFAPSWTETTVARFNGWLNRNGPRAAAAVLAGLGAYLLVRGVLAF